PNGTFTALTTGSYYVQAISANCMSEISNAVLVTVFPNPEVLLNVSGNTISAVINPPTANVTWFFENNTNPVGTGSQLLATESGQYTAVVTDLVGCSTSASIDVVATSTETPSFVKSFRLTPNPTLDKVQLDLELAQLMPLKLVLTDSRQRQIWAQDLNQVTIQLPIDLSHFANGTYYLTIQAGPKSFTRSIIKQ
ncbi:MAG: T9SS type A sorting domain-containing protein, partial [Saprospiraceae bacterium]|nr:T9SS type A sorting domain-containing protein [Saprospiraceae bacterium]